MRTIAKALLWAAVIIAVAVAGHFEWINRDTAQTLTLALPVLAVVTLGSTRSCNAKAEQRA